MNYHEFAEKHGITVRLTAKPYGEVDRRDEKNPWPHVAYQVELCIGGKAMPITWREGVGLVKLPGKMPPSLLMSKYGSLYYAMRKNPYAKFTDIQGMADIAAAVAVSEKRIPSVSDMLCNLSDSLCTFEDAGSFEEFAADFGYDSDSRKAEKLYNDVMDEGRKLKALLGHKLADELLECEE